MNILIVFVDPGRTPFDEASKNLAVATLPAGTKCQAFMP